MKPTVKYFNRDTKKYEYATVVDIGDLNQLNTVVKTNIVSAINSILDGTSDVGGGTGTGEIPPYLQDIIDELIKSQENLDKEIEDIISGATPIQRHELSEEELKQVQEKINQAETKLEETLTNYLLGFENTINNFDERISDFTSGYVSDKEEYDRIIEESKSKLKITEEELQKIRTDMGEKPLNSKTIFQELDEINLEIKNFVSQTSFELLEATVHEVETLSQQTADKIINMVTDTQFNSALERVTSAETKLEQLADRLTVQARRKELRDVFEPLGIYPDNLLLGTRYWDKKYWGNDGFVTNNTYRKTSVSELKSNEKLNYTENIVLKNNDEYTISVWAKSNLNEGYEVLVDIFYPELGKTETIKLSTFDTKDEIVNDSWRRFGKSFIAEGNIAQITIRGINLTNTNPLELAGAKLEWGFGYTGWQDHKDDVMEKIVETSETILNITNDRIEAIVERIENLDLDIDSEELEVLIKNSTYIKQLADSIKLSANTMKELEDSVQNMSAELNIMSDKIESKVSTTEIKDIIQDIDFKNYILNPGINAYSYNEVLLQDVVDNWFVLSNNNLLKNNVIFENIIMSDGNRDRKYSVSIPNKEIKSNIIGVKQNEKINIFVKYIGDINVNNHFKLNELIDKNNISNVNEIISSPEILDSDEKYNVYNLEYTIEITNPATKYIELVLPPNVMYITTAIHKGDMVLSSINNTTDDINAIISNFNSLIEQTDKKILSKVSEEQLIQRTENFITKSETNSLIEQSSDSITQKVHGEISKELDNMIKKDTFSTIIQQLQDSISLKVSSDEIEGIIGENSKLKELENEILLNRGSILLRVKKDEYEEGLRGKLDVTAYESGIETISDELKLYSSNIVNENNSKIISMINLSPERITIDSSKLDINAPVEITEGFKVTFNGEDILSFDNTSQQLIFNAPQLGALEDNIKDELLNEITEIQTKAVDRQEIIQLNELLDSIQSSIEEEEKKSKLAEEELEELLSRINAIDATLGSQNVILRFVESQMVMSDGALFIGDISSRTGIRYGKDRISFMQGRNNEVAWITGNMLHINQGVFVDNLTVGEYNMTNAGYGLAVINWQPGIENAQWESAYNYTPYLKEIKVNSSDHELELILISARYIPYIQLFENATIRLNGEILPGTFTSKEKSGTIGFYLDDGTASWDSVENAISQWNTFGIIRNIESLQAKI